MWKDFLTNFSQAFLGVILPMLATALAGMLAGLVMKGINWVQSKCDLQLQMILNAAVKSAVLAAEQVHLVDAAIQKKDYAVDFATKWLAERGYKINLDVLSDAIEAAVMEEFNKSRVTAGEVAV